jgi:tripartite-type tricarboxylate transporter receptor subunit TctC
MRMMRLVVRNSSICLLAMAASSALSQSFPSKPIRLLPGEAGGGGDYTARMVSQQMSGYLGQPVVVDNRPSGLVPEIVAKAAPDGYNVLVLAGNIWTGPLIQPANYDAVKDLAPITLMTKTPLVVIVHPGVPVNSVADLIALAKAKPGTLNYASGPIGGSAHLGAELFKSMAGVNIVRVPYKGTGPALLGLVGGETQIMINNVVPAIPHIQAGRLKGLAVTSAKPFALLPGMPTVSESVPGYEFVAVFGALTTAGTPPAVIDRLNRDIVRALNDQQVKQKFLKEGSEVAGSSPGEFADFIKSDITRVDKLIKDENIKSE